MEPHMAMKWNQMRDEADRAVWVDRHRNGSESLGKTIAAITAAREAMWEIPIDSPAPSLSERYPSREQVWREPQDKGGKPKGKGEVKPPAKAQGKGIATSLADGTKLCNRFNSGTCTSPNCRFEHKCGMVLPGGGVCGGRHPAVNHRNTNGRKW